MGYDYQIVGKLPELKCVDAIALISNWKDAMPKHDVVAQAVAFSWVNHLQGVCLETSFSTN